VKLLILVIIALAGAIALGMYALEDPGYVVFSVPFGGQDYNVSMPFALFVLFLLITFAALYLFFNFLAGVFRAPAKLAKWRKERKETSAQQHTMKGFAGLIEGDWEGAEGNLMARIDHNNASLMNYLGAAYAAQQQGQVERRNQHLEEALKKHPKQALAIKLTRARMQIQAGEWGEARDQLECLRSSAPKNVSVTRLLADVYRQSGDWSALVHLMPVLGKQKAFPPEELAAREKQALSHHLQAPVLLQDNGTHLEKAFKALPRKAKKDATAIASYARQLMRAGEGQRAETVMRKALNRQWNPELIRLYGMAETSHPKDQLKLLEIWSKAHEEEPALWMALARLYRRTEEPEKARKFYGKVISVTNDSEAINELGDLLEDLGDREDALLTYKQGMKRLSESGSGSAPPILSSEGQLVVLDAPTASAELASDTSIEASPVEQANSLPVLQAAKPA